MVLVTRNGQPACSKCGRRPKVWSGGRWQSYCRICQTEYQRNLRAFTFAMQLTPDEREVVLAMRAKPKGRHAAAAG